jgi:hypothetical protein
MQKCKGKGKEVSPPAQAVPPPTTPTKRMKKLDLSSGGVTGARSSYLFSHCADTSSVPQRFHLHLRSGVVNHLFPQPLPSPVLPLFLLPLESRPAVDASPDTATSQASVKFL